MKMVYRHKYFQVDAKRKKVFDENGKELRLTSNAYRVLVFLCASGSGNVTEIGQFLDWAKDYDENSLRQYRYRINSIVGRDIIEYKNGIYSLVGEAKKANELAQNSRYTDLLQSSPLESNRKAEKVVPFSILPGLFASTLLVLALFHWPYGYYTFLRIVVTGVAVYYGYFMHAVLEKHNFWFWGLIFVAIVFNPFAPIYLYDRKYWGFIDIIAACYFAFFVVIYRNQRNK
jgi:hypothetical protein